MLVPIPQMLYISLLMVQNYAIYKGSGNAIFYNLMYMKEMEVHIPTFP